jgi:hypothetical protein
MKKVFIIIVMFLFATNLVAEDLLDDSFDEGTLFQEEIFVSKPGNTENLAETYTEKKSVNFTGQLRFDSYYAVKRDWLKGKGSFDSNQLMVYTEGDLFLDVRLKKGIKAFMDLGIYNLSSALPSSDVTEGSGLSSGSGSSYVDFKELFLDFNKDREIYFRVGKQFLKWGTTYFWNPTDLVNQDKRNFLDLNRIRSGTYGTKMHIPIGLDRNLYVFLDTSDVDNLDGFACATKYEFILGSSEVGLSMWNKKNRTSVYGVDFSGRLFGFDLKGELALSYGSNANRLVEKDGNLQTGFITDEWVPKATMNWSKTINWERADRITFSYEFFYNGDGYSENLFKNQTKMDYLIDNNLYEMNYMAKTYQAFFVAISEFPTHSTTFNINGIQNLVDYSMIVYSGLTYYVTEGFDISGNIAMYFGQDNSEYLLYGNALQFQLLSRIYF